MADDDPAPKRTKVELSAGKYDVLASDYFNDQRFFTNEKKKNTFVDLLDDFEPQEEVPNALDLRTLKVHELYEKASELYKNDNKELENFFLNAIKLCKRTVVLADYHQWKEETGTGSQNDCRKLVNVDFQITGTDLSHTYDLKCFSDYMNVVFKWHTDKETREKYAAPYFCFVQSSGMGKTKLMYEYKNAVVKNNITSLLVLPPDVVVTEGRDVFTRLDIVNIHPSKDDTMGDAPEQDVSQSNEMGKQLAKSREVAEMIYNKLDKVLLALQLKKTQHGPPKVALLFDESHPLLKREFGFDAFRFRCVRVWLRQIRKDDLDAHVVAVFAGTNSRFADFLFETDQELQNFVPPSRDVQTTTRDYHDKGTNLFLPFFQTTTMGSCLKLRPDSSESEQKANTALSEYERAVFYGRPLFAHLAKENKLDVDKLIVVLRRMLAIPPDASQNWRTFRLAWISLLSTRVQMGQTTAELASDLVASSYANFCGYYPGSRAIRLGYFPDPVCAHLAMCLMDETFEIKVKDSSAIKGAEKKWWAERLMEIFSTGIVSPEKGDFGEVVVALYMLFCGDLLRQDINNDKNLKGVKRYSHFSVSLDAWLNVMLSGGTKEEVQIKESEVSVGFIQVCRNSLRSYEKSWKTLGKESFLEHIYESGIGFYVYPNCPLIDIVAPLRITKDGKVRHIPMLVSIKCREHFPHGEVIKECTKMKKRAEDDMLTEALCLLIIFASESSRSTGYDWKHGGEIVPLLSTHGIVVRAVRVPLNDAFGLTDAFKQMTPAAEIDSEVLSSHTFLMAHGDDCQHEDLEAEKALREMSLRKHQKHFDSLKIAMTHPEALTSTAEADSEVSPPSS